MEARMILDFEQLIKEEVTEALEGCFLDASIYGSGYIKVVFENNNLDVKHIPFDTVETELELHKEIKKLTRSN